MAHWCCCMLPVLAMVYGIISLQCLHIVSVSWLLLLLLFCYVVKSLDSFSPRRLISSGFNVATSCGMRLCHTPNPLHIQYVTAVRAFYLSPLIQRSPVTALILWRCISWRQWGGVSLRRKRSLDLERERDGVRYLWMGEMTNKLKCLQMLRWNCKCHCHMKATWHNVDKSLASHSCSAPTLGPLPFIFLPDRVITSLLWYAELYAVLVLEINSHEN